jgi:hypothetical protein
MLARLSQSLALVLLLAPSARAEDAPPPQHIVYDLSIDGHAIGTRELTVRYLPREDGERRVIEAFTDVTVAGQHLVCRSSGQSSARGANFTSSVDTSGAITQVQGIALPGGGWRITQADAAGVHETTLDKEKVRLTSLDLLDPGRATLLAGGGAMGLVLVETGDVVSGTLDEGTAGTIKVGGQKIAVTRYTLTSPDGAAKFDLGADGLLLKSELRWLGATVVAQAREVPPPRSYGTIETFDPGTTGVSEDPL